MSPSLKIRFSQCQPSVFTSHLLVLRLTSIAAASVSRPLTRAQFFAVNGTLAASTPSPKLARFTNNYENN
jgi:acyl-CoA thioesterase